MSPKPAITELEANWNIHLAGISAEQKARKEGLSQVDGNTLLDAALGGKIIGGILFPPIHAGFMLMLSAVERMSEEQPALKGETADMAALALILHSPEKVWPILRGGHSALFVDAVTEFAMKLNLSELKELTEWIKDEMAKLNAKADVAGKSEAE